MVMDAFQRLLQGLLFHVVNLDRIRQFFGDGCQRRAGGGQRPDLPAVGRGIGSSHHAALMSTIGALHRTRLPGDRHFDRLQGAIAIEPQADLRARQHGELPHAARQLLHLVSDSICRA